MKTTFLRQTTEDKLILQGLFYEPDSPTDRVVLHIHGMAGNFYENKFLDALAKTFTDNGWAFLAPNTRGHDFIADIPVAGGKEDDFKRIGNTFEKFEESVLDIKAWMDFASEKLPKIVLEGHSLGCSKVVYYFSQTKDSRVQKLVLASPADMVGLAEAEKDHHELLSLSKKMISEEKGRELLPKLLWDWYYLSANTYVDFGERDNPIDVFNTYAKERPSVISDVTVPTLAFFGGRDDAAILPVAEALEVIKNKAVNCPKFDTAIIEDAPHSYFAHEQEMAELILRWINEES